MGVVSSLYLCLFWFLVEYFVLPKRASEHSSHLFDVQNQDEGLLHRFYEFDQFSESDE
jgi:hypothetical protein